MVRKWNRNVIPAWKQIQYILIDQYFLKLKILNSYYFRRKIYIFTEFDTVLNYLYNEFRIHMNEIVQEIYDNTLMNEFRTHMNE